MQGGSTCYFAEQDILFCETVTWCLAARITSSINLYCKSIRPLLFILGYSVQLD